ncbi:MAG: FAD-dependent oxidoreductase [Actinomycetaceae bacterium]|nr:FAD-dependent oxidoreductase [Actinomycetaceae bacterium]
MTSTRAMKTADLVVIGGGLAGMCAAYEATQRGLRAVVVETRGRPGGLIASARLGGVPFDIGAESWATRAKPVTALVEELGLETTIPTGRSWVWNQDIARAYPIPNGVLGLPADLEAPEVQAAIGTEGVERARQDLTEPVGQLPADFGTLVEERLGKAVLDHLVRPVAGGIHTADPKLLDADTIAPGLRELTYQHGSLLRAANEIASRNPGPKVAQTEGGMFRLIETLEERIVANGGTVLVRHAATGLKPEADGSWQVQIHPTQRPADPAADPQPCGDPQTWVTERVVVALPGPAAQKLLSEHLDLPTWELPLGAPIAHQVLMVDSDQLNSGPRGSGVLVTAPAHAGHVRAKAVSHLSYKWGWMRQVLPVNRHLLRVSYGRSGEPYPHPTVADAIADVNTALGVSLSPQDVVASMLVRWDGQLAPPTPQHRSQVAQLLAAAQKYPGLAITGAWVAGSGFASVVPHARGAVKELL